MNLTDRELRSFVVLAGQLHFGRSAEMLHISQPALSKQIRGLEEKVGGQLLLRNRREVHLTPAGRMLYSEARRIVRELDDLLESVRWAVHGKSGTLRIGVGVSTVHSLVPPALNRFRKETPRVEARVGDMSTPQQIERLLAGQLDVGFLRLPVNHPRLMTRKVLRERLMLAVSSDLRGKLTARKIAMLPFVMMNRSQSSTFHDHCIRVCNEAGFSPRVVQEADDLFTLLNLVRAGIGVALVPRSAKEMGIHGVRLVDLHLANAEWDIGVAWCKDCESELIRRFVQICLQQS